MMGIAAAVLLAPQSLHLAALMFFTQNPPELVAEGVASYYTVASSSSLTASGEPMRDDLLTCAMLQGEFGEYYLVVSETGGAVICRLNDRGPYIKGRIIDLSEASMRQLAGNDGLVQVKVYLLGSWETLVKLRQNVPSMIPAAALPQ